MRYTRPALTAITALLALTGLGTTAHADSNGRNDNCTITIGTVGDHSNIACGNMTYGDHATTGQGHTTGGLGASLGDLPNECVIFTNSTNENLYRDSVTGFAPNYGAPAVIPPGLTTAPICARDDEESFFYVYYVKHDNGQPTGDQYGYAGGNDAVLSQGCYLGNPNGNPVHVVLGITPPDSDTEACPPLNRG
ncbi:hypothetical protein [Streptomyces sp. NRRL F-2664]|uniref:hypothetical protein n=1 Tax=Streptomyces sp. NRRL F-2664 TaxID=1463842 RepID=UPI00131D1920|nr:hypothetical protein [Streptomyces sp. NRRL F-2664]